jgi:membrane protease subunit (stomatin/prohibitin family)
LSFWDKLRGEFVDVIEWTDDSQDTMVWRFERHGNEIKYGAQLTVRESQVAAFVNEGQIADVFWPGRYVLETQNVPILSTLQGWRHGFESPFKAEIYFVNTRRFTDLKWGTKNPVTLRDPEFGPVRLRAFGTYVIRVMDAGTFIREIAGTDGHFTTDEVTDQLRNLIVSRFSTAIGASGIPVLDLAASYDQLSDFVTRKIAPEFAVYGLELTKLLVENVSLPPAVEQALDKRTSMGVLGDLNRYTQYQTAEAIGTAAANPGGPAGDAMGMGLGMAMAQQMAQAGQAAQQPASPWGQQAQQPAAAPPPPGPPPLPQQSPYYVAINGRQAGPYPVDQLQQLAASGQLTRDSLVWTQGMANWTKAGEVAALSALFGGMPPPLPPAP